MRHFVEIEKSWSSGVKRSDPHHGMKMVFGTWKRVGKSLSPYAAVQSGRMQHWKGTHTSTSEKVLDAKEKQLHQELTARGFKRDKDDASHYSHSDGHEVKVSRWKADASNSRSGITAHMLVKK